MANAKIEDLIELTTPVDADVIPIVDDPGGSPSTKKVTVQNLNKIFAVKVKPADELKNDDDTLADDDTLIFTPNINKTYFIQLSIFYNMTGNAGFKFAMSLPTGAIADWLPNGGHWFQFIGVSSRANATTPIGATQGGNNQNATYIRLIMSTTAGDVAMQWAQNASHANTTTLLAGTSMLVWEE